MHVPPQYMEFRYLSVVFPTAWAPTTWNVSAWGVQVRRSKGCASMVCSLSCFAAALCLHVRHLRVNPSTQTESSSDFCHEHQHVCVALSDVPMRTAHPRAYR